MLTPSSTTATKTPWPVYPAFQADSTPIETLVSFCKEINKPVFLNEGLLRPAFSKSMNHKILTLGFFKWLNNCFYSVSNYAILAMFSKINDYEKFIFLLNWKWF